MVYSSIVFIFIFFPVFLAGYYLLPKIWAKNLFLFIASLVFYFWGAGKLVVLLLVISILAWLFSFFIVKTKFQKIFLILAVCTFSGILFYFRYIGFIIDNLIYVGVQNLPEIKTISTLGLSFFTFQAISYNIEVYRRNKRFEKNPAYVILYITMFPQLILGTLVRYPAIEQQLKKRQFDLPRFTEGVRRFIIGLGKKVLIADQISYVVTQIIETDFWRIGPEVAWVGMLAFALQFFFDFAAYTDMAIGVGKMLGFELPENFNYPYISRSITEFWRRWHITLSNWIKDYIFSPLSLSLRYWGNAGVFFSLVVTFVVCGIWHGPTWNYIIWGLTQGILMGLEALFLLKLLKRIKGFGMLYTWFILLVVGVLFRTQDLKQALDYYSVMFSFPREGTLGLTSFFMKEHYLIMAVGIALCVPISISKFLKKEKTKKVFDSVYTFGLIVVFLLSVMRLITVSFNPFFYFKF